MGLPKIDRPIFTVILPSTGQKIRMQPYTVKEERIMLMAKQSRKMEDVVQAVLQILGNCVVDDIDVHKLASFDVEELMVRLREASVGEAVPLAMSVKSCENENCPCELKATLNLKEMTIPPFKKEKTVVKLNDSSVMSLRYPSLRDMERIAEEENGEEKAKMMVAACIDQIVEGDTVIHPEDIDQKMLLDWIDTFTIDQFEDINAFFQKMPHLTKEITLKCTRCPKTDTFTTSGLEAFFI